MTLCLVGCASRSLAPEYSPGSAPGKYPPTALERAAVLDALDALVEADLGRQVTLEVNSLSIDTPFAAVTATPFTPAGARIDFSGIPAYSAAVETGAFDDQVIALLEKSGGKWQVLEHEIGSTDFPGQEWARIHGAPEDIFAP